MTRVVGSIVSVCAIVSAVSLGLIAHEQHDQSRDERRQACLAAVSVEVGMNVPNPSEPDPNIGSESEEERACLQR